MNELPDRLKRYSKKAIADALDPDFADAVWEAADVQPVKHGLWSGYSCSNCGISKYNFISFNIVGEKEYARPFGTWNYCPRCGAKMDGGI